jgi:dihydrofolate synthase / folylpolyglutamate synthase
VPAPAPAVGGGGLALLDGLSPRGVRLGLDAIGEVLSRIGHPQLSVARVLVAGTNGKGSTAATLSSILTAARVRSGLHTSPHLEHVTERVRIADEPVSASLLDSSLGAVFAAAAKPPKVTLTYFEAITAAAERLFAEEGCDFAVVEVGLGGRLDATNAVDPEISIVTSIGFDHVAELGSTLESIAREKAGIFRAGRLALCRAADPSARRRLEAQARRVGARFADADVLATVSAGGDDGPGQEFSIETPRGCYRVRCPLAGYHQRENVALAVLAAEELEGRFPSIDRRAIERGVAATVWPGRLERFAAGGRTVWLDGCHNPDGAQRLGRFLARRCGFDLLFGVMQDKPIEEIAAPLFPLARRILLAPPSGDRAASPAEIARRVGAAADRAESFESPGAALSALLREPGPEIVVAGSLYLVGETRRWLKSQERS